MARFVRLALVFTACFIPSALGGCECGYIMEDTGDYWTHGIVDDYSKFSNSVGGPATQNALGRDWDVQSWSSSKEPATRKNLIENVWVEDGLLKFRQNGYTKADRAAGGKIEIGEIQTKRNDILFGSFRSSYRVIEQDNTEGVSCSGFFTYATESNSGKGIRGENDIEILTHAPWFDNPRYSIHYTRHHNFPYVDKEEDTKRRHNRKQNLTVPWTEFQEHRMDVHGPETRWYNDGLFMWSLDIVNKYEFRVHMNLWADETGSGWTKTAADKDVEMHVKYMALYFNTTSSHVRDSPEFKERCPTFNKDKVCYANRCQIEPSQTALGNVDYCKGKKPVPPTPSSTPRPSETTKPKPSPTDSKTPPEATNTVKVPDPEQTFVAVPDGNTFKGLVEFLAVEKVKEMKVGLEKEGDSTKKRAALFRA